MMHNLKDLKNVKNRVQLQNKCLLINILKVNLSMSVSLKDQYQWRTALCVYGSVYETCFRCEWLGCGHKKHKRENGQKQTRPSLPGPLILHSVASLSHSHTHTRSRMNCGIHGVHFWNSWLWWSSLGSEASVFCTLLMKLCASVYTWHYTHVHKHM